MTAAMRRLADGDNTVAVPAVGRKDEIGGMANALRVFQASIEERANMAKSAEEEAQLRLERAHRIDPLGHSRPGTHR